MEKLTPEEAQKALKNMKVLLRARFPNIAWEKIGTIKFGETTYPNRIVALGKLLGETPIIKADRTGFTQAFLTGRQRALGPQAETIIAQQNAKIRAFREQMRAAEARVENIEMEDLGMKRKKDELRTLEDKLAKGEARVGQLENDADEDSTTPLLDRKQQLERQKKLNENYRQSRDTLQAEIAQQSKTRAQKVTQEKGKEAELQTQISASGNTRDTLEARLNATKSLDDLRERDAELERKNDEDQQILDDENAPSSEKEAASERIEERNEEGARLRPQIQEREQARPLRERIREIFKKYGWTLQVIVLAAGIVISAVVLTTLNSLAKATKAIGNGLKELGKKAAAALPGLVGSIVGFIFKTAGSVISFLGKHAWLIILAMVAFLVERVTKRARKS